MIGANFEKRYLKERIGVVIRDEMWKYLTACFLFGRMRACFLYSTNRKPRQKCETSRGSVVVFFRMKRETALNEWEMEVATCGRNYRQCLM